MADIIRAYGYAQADVFGISYGALLAQHIMRDHADVVRAVVIDSVLPMDASLSVSGADMAVSAIERLLAGVYGSTGVRGGIPFNHQSRPRNLL